MKHNRGDTPGRLNEKLDRVVDAENMEFDFSDAPRPGRNPKFELAQAHFHEVSDAEDRARSADRLSRARSD